MAKVSSAHLPGKNHLQNALLLLVLLLASIPACARSYRVANFESTIHVDEDGSARVQEKISFAFNGAFQGIYRNIPVDYPGPRGSNYSLFIKNRFNYRR